MWRSPVAHTPGGRGAASSNLVIPTMSIKELRRFRRDSFFFDIMEEAIRTIMEGL